MSIADKPNRKGTDAAPRAAKLTVYLKPGEITALRSQQEQPNKREEADPPSNLASSSQSTSQDAPSEEFDAFGAAFDALPEEFESEVASEAASEVDALSAFGEALPIDDGLPDHLEEFGLSQDEVAVTEDEVVGEAYAAIPSHEDEPPYERFVEPEPPAQMAVPTARIIRAPIATPPVEPLLEERAEFVDEEEPTPIEVRDIPDPEVDAPYSEEQPQGEPEPRLQALNVNWPSDALVGFLVCFDNERSGDFVELRAGRLVVTCEPMTGGASLVIDHPSVSPMHAVIRIEVGRPLQILDQLSEYGTRIIRSRTGREESLSGERSTLNHGDVVIFGERRYHVCLVSIEPGANG